MLTNNCPENFDKITVKNAQARSIPVDELTFENLTGSELKVYMAIRFESDYSKRFSEVQISINYISKKAKVSRAKVFEALNSLEYNHFLLQRLNYQQFKRGQINSFLVSRDYKYFKQIVGSQNTHPENDTGVQNLHTRPDSGLTRPDSGLTRPENDILIDQEYSQESSQNILLLDPAVDPAREKPKKINKNYEYPDTLYQQQPTVSEQLSNQNNYKKMEMATLTNLTYEEKIRNIIESCANDIECQNEFEKKFKSYDYEYRRILEECTSHYTTQNRLFDKFKFIDWIKNTCPIRKKLKTKIEVQKESMFHYGSLTKEQQELVQNRKWEKINPDRGQRLSTGQQIEADRLIKLLEEASSLIPYEAMSEQEKSTMRQFDASEFRAIVSNVLDIQPEKQINKIRKNPNIEIFEQKIPEQIKNLMGKIPEPSKNGLISLPVGGYNKPKQEVKKPSISLADRLKQINRG